MTFRRELRHQDFIVQPYKVYLNSRRIFFNPTFYLSVQMIIHIGMQVQGFSEGGLPTNSTRCSGFSDHHPAHVQAKYTREILLGLGIRGRVEYSSRLWEESQKLMPKWEFRNECWRGGQKWMLEPEVNAMREQGLKNTTETLSRRPFLSGQVL